MSNSNNGGIGFLGALALIFIVLKLVGVISWSWWLVLAPIWISLFGAGIVLVIILIVWLITKL